MCTSYSRLDIFITYEYTANSQRDQPPVGLIAQLVEHCIGIAEPVGFIPVRACFFSFIFAIT